MDGFKCNICSKLYSSYKSLWNHNKKFHKNDVTGNVTNVTGNVTDVTGNVTENVTGNVTENVTGNTIIKLNICKYCNKEFKNRQNKWEHQNKYCKKNKKDNNKIAKLEKENIKIKNTLNQLLKMCKIHPKTLQKINNQLVNSNNSINNGTINNVNIVKFGTEDLNKILTQSEILKILNRKMCSLEESIKMIHFNDLRPEFKNIYITNLKDQYAYTYDGNKFIAVLKSDILEELVDNHFENIEYSADEYKEKLGKNTIDVLDKFIEKMNNDDDEFIDNEHKKIYPNFRNYHINQIRMMIYNMSDNKTKVVNVICSKNEIPF